MPRLRHPGRVAIVDVSEQRAEQLRARGYTDAGAEPSPRQEVPAYEGGGLSEAEVPRPTVYEEIMPRRQREHDRANWRPREAPEPVPPRRSTFL